MSEWYIIENALDVAEGKLNTSWASSDVSEYYFLNQITSGKLKDQYPSINKVFSGISINDMRSYVKTEIRNWRIDQIDGKKVDDIFVIELPRGEKVQLLPEVGKRVGVRRLDSDDIIWLPLVGTQGYQGSSGI